VSWPISHSESLCPLLLSFLLLALPMWFSCKLWKFLLRSWRTTKLHSHDAFARMMKQVTRAFKQRLPALFGNWSCYNSNFEKSCIFTHQEGCLLLADSKSTNEQSVNETGSEDNSQTSDDASAPCFWVSQWWRRHWKPQFPIVIRFTTINSSHNYFPWLK
jgi:hypothetical protein